MARFVENRLRCPIDPGKKKTPFVDVLNDSQGLITFKDTTFALEFALFNGTSLYDIANIISISALVTDGSAAVLPVKTLDQSQLNNALSLDATVAARWQNNEDGDEHGVFEWTQDENLLAAGTYDVTIFGLTAKGREVFGISKLTSVDRKITNFIAAPPPGVQYATVADVVALNKQTVKYGRNPKGKFPILVNEEETFGLPLRCGANGEFIADPIQNP